MAGIMTPITFNTGRQRAVKDNQADERFDQQTRIDDQRIRGLELDNQRKGFEFGQQQKDAPLKQMKRDADTIAEIAKFGAANLDRVSDEDVAEYMAQLLSDMPAFGKVNVQNGQLFDGKRARPMDRQSALQLLRGLSDPAKAMEVKTREAQYINEQGQIETMTAGEAKGRGLGLATDRKAGYELNKARVDDQFAEEKAGLDIRKLRSEIAKNYATANKDMGEGTTRYKFPAQNPDSIREGVMERTMIEMGYQQQEVFNERTGMFSKTWASPDGEPVTPEEIQDAVALSDEVLTILSSGLARDTVEAMEMAKDNRRSIGGGFEVETVRPRKEPPVKKKPPLARGLENANLSRLMPQVKRNDDGTVSLVTEADRQQATPPIEGARQAPDGNWYVQKDGKFYRVNPGN